MCAVVEPERETFFWHLGSLHVGLPPSCGFVVLSADAGEHCQVNCLVYSCVLIIPVLPVSVAFVLLKQ